MDVDAGSGTLRHYDEDDVRVRPSRGTRPRSRRRPKHADAVIGLVTTVDRGRYTCAVGATIVTAIAARELGKRAVVVGDRVAITGDITGRQDALARIVRIEDRTSVLRRSADDGDPFERIVVANAERLAIVAALADPPPRTGLIDRCLVAAEDADIHPLLILTKEDLGSPEEIHSYYRGIDLDMVTWQHGTDTAEIAELLAGHTSVLVGHSGVGKSTLVNAMVPDAERATGAVSGVGKGRHTSTSAAALRLPGGGWVIDTPGIRSFGLAHIPPEDLIHGFSDLLPGSLQCEPGCDHAEPKDSCALDGWCEQGNAPVARLESFRSLLASLRGADAPK